MAGEDSRYTSWIRLQRCAACLGIGPCHAHHSTNGGTDSPDGPRSPKSFGGRRGKSQKAHDHHCIPMHHKCHANFHDKKGQFAGWTKEQQRAWQDEQVAAWRGLYETNVERHPQVTPARAQGKRKPVGEWPRERAALVEFVRDFGGERHHPPEVVQAVNDLADMIAARTAPFARST